MKKTLPKLFSCPDARFALPPAAPRRPWLRLSGGLALLSLVAAVGLVSSRPAHTAGGPIAVNVANTVPTVDVDNAARQPVAINLLPDTEHFGSFTVPAGKRLVIQQVSAITTSNTLQEVELNASVSGTDSPLSLPFTATGGGLQYAGGPVTFYADPGTTVRIFLDGSNSSGDFAQVEIVGYYVNVP
jgi:hypothetical protein